MSADNGVYILKTKDQYRVAHLQAIENLSWSAIDGRWDFSEKAKERYVPTRVMEMWGGCKYTRNREVAFQIAQRMVRNLRICEYGIHVITYNKTWRRIAEDAREYAKKEVEYIRKNGRAGNGMWDLERLQAMAEGEYLSSDCHLTAFITEKSN